MDTATILHADLDAFYASVEQMLDPSLKGKPIAVGGGVVLAASYEAKAFGVHGGMPGRRARELCPDLVFVGGHFKEYQGSATPRSGYWGLHAAGRADLDRRGFRRRRRLHAPLRHAGLDRRGDPPTRARRTGPSHLRRRRQHKAPRQDRLAGRQARRAGRRRPGDELAFLHDLPVEMMWGVGPATRARLAESGIATIGDLARSSPGAIARLLGRAVGEAGRPRRIRDPALSGRCRRPLGWRPVEHGAGGGR